MPRPDPAPLVGRKGELDFLSKTLDNAAKGAGGSVFIVGEGGIGKTRLATAAADLAAKEGWNVAIGRSYPVETGVPYALFSDALLPFVRAFDPATLAVLTRGAPELRYLIPRSRGQQPRARFGATLRDQGTAAGNSPSFYHDSTRTAAVLVIGTCTGEPRAGAAPFRSAQNREPADRLLGTYSKPSGTPTQFCAAPSNVVPGTSRETLDPIGEEEVEEIVEQCVSTRL